jgi:hypothetical protein
MLSNLSKVLLNVKFARKLFQKTLPLYAEEKRSLPEKALRTELFGTDKGRRSLALPLTTNKIRLL